MRQGFGLVSLFTALFNSILLAARSFVHAAFECLEACRKGCISLIQLLRQPGETNLAVSTFADENILPPPFPNHVDQESITSTARASDSSTTTNRSDRSTPSRTPPDSPPPPQITPDPGDLQQLGTSFSDDSILSEQ